MHPALRNALLALVITGGIFVLCVLAFRRGIVGELIEFWHRQRRAPAATQAVLRKVAVAPQE